jgi:hypothetical protein
VLPPHACTPAWHACSFVGLRPFVIGDGAHHLRSLALSMWQVSTAVPRLRLWIAPL